MIQVILILAGAILLFMKSVKLSTNKVIVRPQTIYLGVLLIVGGVGMNYLGDNSLVNVIFYVFLFAIAAIFAWRTPALDGSKKDGLDIDKSSSLNLVILAIAAIFIAFIFYYILNK